MINREAKATKVGDDDRVRAAAAMQRQMLAVKRNLSAMQQAKKESQHYSGAASLTLTVLSSDADMMCLQSPEKLTLLTPAV